MVAAKPCAADLIFLNDLFEAGSVKPAIDRRFSLDEVREALRYLGTGHARAKIVGTVAGGDTQTFPRRGTRRLKHV